MATIREMLVAGLMAAGMSGATVLGASLPAWADDITRSESGSAGDPGEDGDNGGAGAHGTYVGNIEGVLTGLPGGNGGSGVNGTAGKPGEDGGYVQVTTSGPTDGSIVISVNGGAGGHGGQGGNGGNGGAGGTANPNFGDNAVSGIPAAGGKGGEGGDAGAGGSGGRGGAGGFIQVAIHSDVTGDIVLSSAGGFGGEGGAGGLGGNGGNGGAVFVYGAVGTIGDGGDGGDGIEGGLGGKTVGGLAILGSLAGGKLGADGNALPQQYGGAAGADGAGGSITLVLSADVGGNVSADAGTGTVRVTLNTGASVGGVIAANEAANSALRFAMTVNSRAEYKAAKAYLGDNANALSGSLTINGQTFTWSGFDQLVQTLVLAGVRSSTSSDTGAPLYLACTPRVVTAFYADGAIALVARRTGERGAFRIGQIMNGAFDSQNTFGWRAALTTAKGQAAFDVLDGTGAKVAACRG